MPSTAMVRIGDVVNSETRNIEEELAGGLTVAHLLHGSANPIGGQNCVVKFRDGAAPEAMKFEGAPEGIKFALGENVKQSNWGESTRTRFPQSRMGVPVFMRNRFQAARAYAEAMRNAPDKTQRDLELDAIVEIIDPGNGNAGPAAARALVPAVRAGVLAAVDAEVERRVERLELVSGQHLLFGAHGIFDGVAERVLAHDVVLEARDQAAGLAKRA